MFAGQSRTEVCAPAPHMRGEILEYLYGSGGNDTLARTRVVGGCLEDPITSTKGSAHTKQHPGPLCTVHGLKVAPGWTTSYPKSGV